MKIVNRRNAIPILSCTYTVISLTNAITELVCHQKNVNEAMNALTILGVSAMAMFILSLHHRLQKWNLLLVILAQYIVFIGSVLLLVYLGSMIEPVLEGGYRDMFLSGSFSYLIGAIIYYISFFLQIRRQNQMLEKIQKSEQQREEIR